MPAIRDIIPFFIQSMKTKVGKAISRPGRGARAMAAASHFA